MTTEEAITELNQIIDIRGQGEVKTFGAEMVF